MFSHIKELFTRPSGYTISRSVRLRSSASGYFNRTLTTPTNNKIWTWSGWVKRGILGTTTNRTLFRAGVTSPSNGIRFEATTDVLRLFFNDASSGDLVTTQVFRDPSAWYHIIVVVDTTQATAANRVKIYINGAQVTAFSTASYPAQNYDPQINSAILHTIGAFNASGTPAEFFDGYMTEINFIDGQALTPSSFGETDSITGVWKAKKYSGTYGTNGFYLNFSDNSSNTATTIGKDYSGNGNNWTPNNISVTSGVTYDSMVDSPTVSAVSSNYCVLNPLQPASTTVVVPTDGNLKMTGTASGNNVTGTMAIGTTTYFEGTVITGGGTVEFGVKNLDTGNIYVYDSNGNKYLAGTGTAYGATFTSNDIIGVAVDPTNLTLQFYKNNTSQGVISSAFPSGNYVPFFYASNTNASAANFGQRPFTYTPPTGFVALNTYNLPASTITNGAAYMAATTYSGNATAGRSIVNSGGFAPDFVWIKGRSTISNHYLYDSIRGVNNQLLSNATNAEATITDRMTAFNSNGFTIGSSSEVNGNTESYIGWQWKAGGTSSSNTNGSITSTVSVGATQGFSVVTYTGNGTAGATIGHGLGATPSMIIVKDRGGHSNNWAVWNSGFTTTSQTLFLDLTAASTTYTNRFDSSGFTSSVFKVGTTIGEVNTSTYNYVAYCFAAVAGYSAFGSYTGNGSTDGPFVYTGFRPRFFMIKRTDTTTNWIMYDTTRMPYNTNPVGPIYANLSNAEETNITLTAFDILSNGFKPRNTSSWAESNASGGTYIYMAFAEVGFKSALAR